LYRGFYCDIFIHAYNVPWFDSLLHSASSSSPIRTILTGLIVVFSYKYI
jgi:hypothetical protein